MDDRTKRSFKVMEESTTSAISPKVMNKSLTSAQNGVHGALIDALLGQPIDSPTLPNIIDNLASLSRKSEDVRERLAQNDVLGKLLQYLRIRGGHANLEPTTATVRCVGNACISNVDACKTVASHGFSWVRSLLVSDETKDLTQLRSITIKALYNLCSQSEDAQVQCFHDSVHQSIVGALSETSETSDQASGVPGEDLSAAIDVLLGISSHYKDLGKDQALPNDVERSLLQCSHTLLDKLDVEDHVSLLEVTLTFLRSTATQTQVVEQGDVALVWTVLVDNERKIDRLDQNAAEDNKMLKALSSSLVWILSDLAAHPSFAVNQLLDPSFINGLVNLIVGADTKHKGGSIAKVDVQGQSPTQLTAACQILGNLVHALPPDEQTTFVQMHTMHSALFAKMASSDDADFLHSAAGLLVQLSRSSLAIREHMGLDEHAMAAVKKLSDHSNPQLKTTALSLMRALGKEVPAVQERFKALAGEVMGEVAEAQKSANGPSDQPAMPSMRATTETPI